MHIVTKATRARGVAARWKKAYYYGGEWRKTAFGPTKKVYDQLVAAGENITPEQVNATIGNESWTQNVCTECDRDVEITVHFGEEPDYDAVWADVCPRCLRKALALLEGNEGNGKKRSGQEQIDG